MVCKHPRPNHYVSSADLSHRLTANALTPRPPQMSKACSWWQDLKDCDKLYWGFVIGIFAAGVVVYLSMPWLVGQ